MHSTIITLTFCFSLIQIIYSVSNDTTRTNVRTVYEDSGEDRFFYFAYGSNLLRRRIRINNPSAVFYRTGKLMHHRLDFYMVSDTWNGAVATIVEDRGEAVMGTLWLIDIDQMDNLDEQEGVGLGWYYAKNVTVTTPNGGKVLARTYEEVEEPPRLEKGQMIPIDRIPSSTYLEVIVLGAIEAGLPPAYIAYLMSWPTNGKMANEDLRRQLEYPF